MNLSKLKIMSVVGARPNFMKIAPFIHEINKRNTIAKSFIEHILVHTGQHYDDRMSQNFFKSLNIPNADVNLKIGSGTHAEQVGQTMIAFEKILVKEKPDWVVVGDVNATLACSVTAKKHHVKVCHIEAGLRSGDEEMPEEINRLVTDRISDLLLTPDKISTQNLLNEGIEQHKIDFVGNIMIDTLESNCQKALELSISNIIKNNQIKGNSYLKTSSSFQQNKFGVVTLHRPSNVDQKEILEPIIRFLLDEVSKDLTIIWPIHPRTQKQLQSFDLWDEVLNNPGLILLHPLEYHEMLKLNLDSKIMLTDSGGLQEECTVIGTPCLTLRWNTERPVTLKQNGGVSVLVGNNIEVIKNEYYNSINSELSPICPTLWDGKTARRCVDSILNHNKQFQ